MLQKGGCVATAFLYMVTLKNALYNSIIKKIMGEVRLILEIDNMGVI